MLAATLSREATLENTMQHLQVQDVCDDSSCKIKELKVMVQHKKIGKIREGRGGQSTWPLYIWELVMKQLFCVFPLQLYTKALAVHSVNMLQASSLAVQCQLIQFSVHGLCLLLVVVQTLALYRIDWLEQTSGRSYCTTPHRVAGCLSRIYLVISIEEDELFRYVSNIIDLSNVQTWLALIYIVVVGFIF